MSHYISSSGNLVLFVPFNTIHYYLNSKFRINQKQKSKKKNLFKYKIEKSSSFSSWQKNHNFPCQRISKGILFPSLFFFFFSYGVFMPRNIEKPIFMVFVRFAPLNKNNGLAEIPPSFLPNIFGEPCRKYHNESKKNPVPHARS